MKLPVQGTGCAPKYTWFGSKPHYLEVRERRLELRPTPDGILAEFIEPDGAKTNRAVDLDSDPQGLIKEWLG